MLFSVSLPRLETQIMSSDVMEGILEKMAMAIAKDHVPVEERSEYSWDAADDVFRRSFRRKARRYLEAGLVQLTLPGDAITSRAITEVGQLADHAAQGAREAARRLDSADTSDATGDVARDVVRAALKWAVLQGEHEHRLSAGGFDNKEQELDLFESLEDFKEAALALAKCASPVDGADACGADRDTSLMDKPRSKCPPSTPCMHHYGPSAEPSDRIPMTDDLDVRMGGKRKRADLVAGLKGVTRE
jgi:hypothetical protein